MPGLMGGRGLMTKPSASVADDFSIGDDLVVTGDLSVGAELAFTIPALKTTSVEANAPHTIWNGATLTATMPSNPANGTLRKVTNAHASLLTVAAGSGDTLNQIVFLAQGQAATLMFLSSSRIWYAFALPSRSTSPLWKHDNIADALTDNNTGGWGISSATHKRWQVVRPTLVTAISAHLNSAAGSAGTCTFSIFVSADGVAAASDAGSGFDITLTPGSAPGEVAGQTVYTTPLYVAAGASLELRTSSASWNHTTADALVTLELQA